ncbi:hypothetical protein ACHAXR_008843 [Thalassiosira sp. AJA248-18]
MVKGKLNNYPLPPSMTPEKPRDSKGSGGRRGNDVQLSESWTRRLSSSAVGNDNKAAASRQSSSSSSSNANANANAGSGYQPPKSPPRSSPRSSQPMPSPAPTATRRQPFDIEQQHPSDAAASGRPDSKKRAYLRSLSKKLSSSGQSGKSISNPKLLSPHSTAREKEMNNNLQQPPPSSLSTSSPPLQPPDQQPSSISQSFSTTKGSTYHIQPRNYKGFSTPFCGLFATSGGLPTADHVHPQLHHQRDLNHHQREIQTSHLRTDLCSLPCFGVLQADHTRYLFTHTRPPTFCKRIRKKRVMVREEILWRLRRREEKIKKRMEKQRERLTLGGGTMSSEAEEEDEYEYYSEDEYEYHQSGYETSLGQSRFEMNCAHRILGCYPSDIPGEPCCSKGDETDDYILQQPENAAGGDLCTKLWSTCCAKPCLPCFPCCNNSYGCHIQFCGLCALSQEAREANLTLPRHLRMIDYITMEPFLLYYPRIVELRRSAVNSFWEHCQAISALSKLLLVSFKVILVALTVISLSTAVGYWNLADMAVLFTTFLQSFAVMYLIHWGWHRYDLSIDAVIKYFACGFAICTSMAFTVELLEYLAFQLAVLFMCYVLGVTEAQDNGYGGAGMHMASDEWNSGRFLKFFGLDSDARVGHGRSLAAGSDILQGFFSRQPAAKILYILISSYVMAGLVEELCKYFGFVMVDHPDFCSERELEKAKATMPLQLLRDRAEDEDEEDPTENQCGPNQKNEEAPAPRIMVTDTTLASFNPAMQRRSLSSIRSGVTVAMVAVALGFACCENILHIFIYNRSSLRSEIATLIVKSMFPVHPIAAAIQSIYVCRRDLEKDPSIGLGRIVLPSIIFHGTYDFALLMITSSWQRGHKDQYFYQGENVTGVAIMSFCVSLCIVLAGGLYYFFSSRAQYARLRGESGSGGNSALSETSFGLLA